MAIPFSVTGSPVVVLPTGLVDGLPFGMQVIGKRWQEDSLLTVSARLEGVFGGFLEAPMFSMT
jgi:amidase